MRSFLRPWLATAALTSLIACTGTGERADAPEPAPNIVLIVADDLGWADVHANDPLQRRFYATPNLDRLAAQGMRYTNAYANAPNCAPSRAALATGLRYPAQPIYTVGSGARGRKELRQFEPVKNVTSLPTRYETLAECMQQRGYATWFVGKWHLGDPGESGPLEHGFEVNVAGNHLGHPKSYFSPYRNANLEDGPEGEYLTERLTNEARALIAGHGDEPFFLQLAYYTVHTPLQAPASTVEIYRGRDKDRGHGHAKYGAMIHHMDVQVGRVLDALDEAGLSDNTLVVFTSDNGGLGGYVAEGLPGRDITSQAPLRGGKGMLYEGGIRVPLFARWPGHIPPGAVHDEPVTQVDLMPTFCGVTEQPLTGTGHHGQDLARSFRGEYMGERQLVWYFPGYLERNKDTFRTGPGIAMRRGRYKIVHFFEGDRSEVYDLIDDVGETHDLAVEQPELARSLLGDVLTWLDESRAPVPMPRN
jgi:arylsulfatase A-like enzyme